MASQYPHPAAECSDTIVQVDFCAFTGKTWIRYLQWLVQEEGSEAVPIPLNNVTAMSMVLRTPNIDSAPALSLSLGNGLEITDPDNGEFTVRIEDTFWVMPTFYYYDIEFIFNNTDHTLLPMVGAFTVLETSSV